MTENASSAFDIPDAVYGAATDTIRRILNQAATMQWFPTVQKYDGEVQIGVLVIQHFDLLGGRTHRSNVRPTLRFVYGDWKLLAENYLLINHQAGDDPAYDRGEWRRSLAETAGELHRVIELSHAALLQPPLFPFAGKATILGGMLTTSLRGAVFVAESACRDAVWYLMCDVDSDYWSAIFEALADPDGGGVQNPYSVLIDIYSQGYYPLGFDEQNYFVIYGHE